VVFIILAKKADRLRDGTILSGWLYQTARLTSASFLRTEIRRARREQEAYMQSLSNEPEATVWPEIEPLLEDAMGRLGEKERDALALRFFEEKSFQEIGIIVGASENAAKKRVSHGLEKLRKFFSKRGVVSTTAIIAGAMSANSVQAAPALLAKSVTALAIAKGAAASDSTLILIKGALKIMAWTKAKTVIGVSFGLLLATGTTVAFWPFHSGKDAWQQRFDAVYKLKDGEVLRYIAPPFIDERAEYYHTEKILQSQAKAIPKGPDLFVFKQANNGQLQYTRCGFGFKQHSLQQILDDPLGFWRIEFEAPDELLNLNLPGDWTIREGVSREVLLAALEPILFKTTGRKIHFEKQTVERNVIVARGRAKDPDSEPRVQIYAEKSSVRGGGTGSGNLRQLLGMVGEQLNTYIVNEAQVDPRYVDLFDWTYYPDANYSKMGNRREELTDKVLKNLTTQMGLTFTHEQRPVNIWFVTEQE
jgi:RNA polymerase sigma factor (sigma-70 family)